ncbi:DUF6985 domain-containing protein [Pseudobutyrivibrio ruminis]|uniref:DUF6985 domain-containing protein n=1 Tax=Pseudobutyrivibrio ruminis TaxID=46206 RepID=UPI00051AD02D|nr:hypothetical protein [Pseudobutyrivibrio ruminis]
MSKIKLNIWGRNFDLPMSVKTFKGKEPTDVQKEAVAKFEANTDMIGTAQNEVEKYILANGLKENGIDKVDNIFKYVIPKAIVVPKAKNRVVGLICNFKFDEEHGLAVVFENEKFKKIGAQDIVL